MHEACLFNNKLYVRIVQPKIKKFKFKSRNLGIKGQYSLRLTMRWAASTFPTFSAHETKELKTHLPRQKCAKTHVRQSGV